MRYSITTKTTIIFAIAFSVVCLLFFTFLNIQSEKTMDSVYEKQVGSINYLLSLYEKGNPPQNLRRYFSNFDLVYVDDKDFGEKILKNGEVVFKNRTPIGVVSFISFNKEMFLSIENVSFSLLLRSKDSKNSNDTLVFTFLVISLVLISMYISVLKSLLPLRRLSKDIRRFADGDVDVALCPVSTSVRSQDEISNVAREFDNAICKIKELIRSRQFFLRAIMHELKTPIGKGRIVCEMLSDDTQKQRLIAIFERLELLISEFGKIEQLLSKNYALNYQENHISLVIEQVEDMMMLDKFYEKVSVGMASDVMIRADFQLLCLAVKNLLDNALKYASNGRAQIECDENEIAVSNLGKPLSQPIDYYLQAFNRGAKDELNSAGGLGLGLYIVAQICSMHKFALEYEFIDGRHYFRIKFKKEQI